MKFQDYRRMKNNEIKNIMVPKLRFSEFRDKGDWKEKQLSNILDYERPDNYIVSDTNYGSTGIPVLTANKSFILGYTQEEYGICKNIPTIIFDDFTVDQKYVDFPFKVKSSAIKILRPKGKDNLKFIYELMALIRFEAKEHKRYYISAYQNQVVLVPQPNEQQKIADCLSSIDELITMQSQKLENLKVHKKSLMQQLFPTDGETIPKFRFPEFRDREWKKQKVSVLLSKIVTPVNVVPEDTYYEIGIRSHGKGIFHKEAVTGKTLGNKRVFQVKENAFILNIVFAWEQAVAVTSAAENGMIASHRFPMYRAKENKTDVNFIKYFFLTSRGKDLLWIASPGGAGRNKTLGQKEFEKLELLLPEKVEEQTKIAHCLSSIEELITTQTEKLDMLKAHKKGLLQQLFPYNDLII
jgi:type I restriction enzyme S subunit